MGVWYWVHWGVVEEVVQSFCRLAGDSPWAAWVLSFPASCFTRRPSYFTRFPVLLGPKEFAGGAASYKSGSPTTSSLSRARQMPGTTWPQGLQAPRCPGRQRKALPRPDHPPPRSPKAQQRRRQAPAPRRRRCHSPGGLSPEEQARAEVRVLQRVGLPHLAGRGGRGPGSRCSGDGAAPGGAGGEAGGSDTARSSLREVEPPASGSGAQRGPPAQCLCPWGLESGAVGAAGPRGSQPGSAGGRAGEARLQARLMEPLRETAAPKAPDAGGTTDTRSRPPAA